MVVLEMSLMAGLTFPREASAVPGCSPAGVGLSVQGEGRRGEAGAELEARSMVGADGKQLSQGLGTSREEIVLLKKL